MNDHKYETPHYILELQRRARCQQPTRDIRDIIKDRARRRRELQANVYGAVTGIVGAFWVGWVLGWWGF